VRSHFKYLADLCKQLVAMGKLVMDKNYTDMLLTSLPTSYDRAILSISMSAHLSTKVLTAKIFKQFILDKFRSRTNMQGAKMKPKPQTQAGAKAKTSPRTRRRSNATTVARLYITSISVGPKVEVRKAKDYGRAKV
jgi:hypothetical protein